jgi:Zn-dependent M16 (insulinase) family peptidase
MKGSLNTFLNAFTYPDRTCYPVASTNAADFYNLVDVYLDAVLHPRCISDPQTFAQEGWHLELDDASKPEGMTLKGVVFNEMKGVYSSPDSVFYRAVQRALFPDNTYSHDSGGDPAAIPDLTFEKFRDFHARYYHPSNARLWFYGDDEPTRRLELLDAYLSEFDARADAPASSAVATQALKRQPREVVERYAAASAAAAPADEDGDDDDADDADAAAALSAAAAPDADQKAYVAVNWVLADEPLDVETELALGFLDYLLLGTSAAPLKKALNDSRLGSALVGGGIDDELKQPIFCVGLKGVEPADADKVTALVLAKLEELEREGFSASAVEAAVNTIEFSLRENNTGSFPRGLSLMLRAVGAWIYDRDPYVPIQWEDALTSFKAKLEAQGAKAVFGPLIRRFLLDNGHRVTVKLLPDAKLGAEIEAAEKARVEAARAAMSADEVGRVAEETRRLKERQEAPDSAEALACMPSLRLSDIPREVTPVPTVVDAGLAGGAATLLTHELFTNDVLYAEVGLDMRRVPKALLPLVPLFCRSLTQMGTDAESFVELTERIGRKTGGLSAYPYTSARRGRPLEPVALVMLRGKAMAGKSGELLALAEDVLLRARLDDRARFRQMVAETRASLEAGIVGSGHRFAGARLAAMRSVAGWMGEVMGGYSYLEFIRALGARVDSDDEATGWPSVARDLASIRAALLRAEGAVVNLTGDAAALARARPHVERLLGALPASNDASSSLQPWATGEEGAALLLPLRNEALAVPTQVNYVGKAANLYEDAGYELSGAAYVVEKHLGTSWLWDRVRVVGGAYGGFGSFDSHSGLFTYLSYRDPNLLETVEAYDGAVGYLRALELDPEALTKAIIGTIGDVDGYQLPDAKGYSQLSRWLLGVTDEERQKRRDQILATTPADFRKFADALEAVRSGEKARVVAVTSAERADKVNAENPGFWDVKKVL